MHGFHPHSLVLLQGSAWWACWKGNKTAPPCDGYARPDLLQLVRGHNVSLTNFLAINSPNWNLHLANISHIYIGNVSVLNPPDSPNTDGVDIDCR